MLETITLTTNKRVEFKDITNEIKSVIRKSNISEGICVVFSPHTTAGITINEHADPAVVYDIITQLNKRIPFDDNYSHTEGNSAAHIKTSIIGSSETIIIRGGSLLLGTWQGIFFCEFDGPRTRKVHVRVVPV